MKGGISIETPNWEGGQQVSVQCQGSETVKADESDLVDVNEVVVVQIQLFQVVEGGEFVASDFAQIVVLQMKDFQSVETGERVVAHRDDIGSVEVELFDVSPAQKRLRIDVVKAVAVQSDYCSVERDQHGNVAMVLGGAAHDVAAPSAVVKAIATVGALEETIARDKVAAAALGGAVDVVAAQEFFRFDIEDGHGLGDDDVRLGGVGPGGDGAPQVGQVFDFAQLGAGLPASEMAGLVEGSSDPFQMAIALEGVSVQRELGDVNL